MDLPRISSFVLYYLGVAAILDFDIIFDTEYLLTTVHIEPETKWPTFCRRHF